MAECKIKKWKFPRVRNKRKTESTNKPHLMLLKKNTKQNKTKPSPKTNLCAFFNWPEREFKAISFTFHSVFNKKIKKYIRSLEREPTVKEKQEKKIKKGELEPKETETAA